MKKLLYICIALFAFIIGIFIFYIRPLLVPVPLSEIDGKFALYKSLEIKVKGRFFMSKSHIGDFYLYQFDDDSNKCTEDSPYCFSEALIELPEEVKKRKDLLIKELVERNYQHDLENCDSEMRECNSNGRFGADVEITGYVEERPPIFNGIPVFVIKVDDIKQTSPTKFITIRKFTD
jgi:hypothetical protein